MNIFLVNSAVYPPVSTQVASNVQVSSGSYQVSSLTGTGTGYQINLMSTTSGAILAQSNQFTLINVSPASGGVSSSASSSSMLSTTSSASAPASTASTGSTASTASTASVASTRSTMSTASSASTASTATASGTPSGTASAASTSGTSTASSTSSATPSSGATVNAINLAGLGLGGLLALFA
ncbi:hypothetical protein MMC13_008297 [Lambiella insularis]|nr:hypothetical protein [Lambiella insularis]